MLIRTRVLAMGMAGALGVMAVSGAQASLLASAMFEIDNFEIQGAGSGQALDWATDFQAVSFTSTSGMFVSFNGATDSADNAGSTSPVDFTPICVGSGCGALALGNNAFPALSGPTTLNYAAADQVETGSPIDNTPNFPAAAGANVGNAAYAGIATGSGGGSATSDNGLSAGFQFQLASAGALDFVFDANAYLEAFASAGEVAPGFAQASYDFSLQIEDLTGGSGVVWQVDVINQGISVNALGLGVDLRALGAGQTAGTVQTFLNQLLTTPVLDSTRVYQLTAQVNANADVTRQAVPAPGILALMGIGLVALGRLASRREHA